MLWKAFFFLVSSSLGWSQPVQHGFVQVQVGSLELRLFSAYPWGDDLERQPLSSVMVLALLSDRTQFGVLKKLAQMRRLLCRCQDHDTDVWETEDREVHVIEIGENHIYASVGVLLICGAPKSGTPSSSTRLKRVAIRVLQEKSDRDIPWSAVFDRSVEIVQGPQTPMMHRTGVVHCLAPIHGALLSVPWVLEWMLYHRELGIDQVHVYAHEDISRDLMASIHALGRMGAGTFGDSESFAVLCTFLYQIATKLYQNIEYLFFYRSV